MAITIITEPDELHPAFNDVLWTIFSTRCYDVYTPGITSVSNNGSGKCRYHFSYPDSEFIAGDVMIGEGFSVTSYNVTQSVTLATSTYIDTNIAFVSTSTGLLLRHNSNIQIKAEIRSPSGSTIIATKYARPYIEDGVYYIDFEISEILNSYKDEFFDKLTLGASDIVSNVAYNAGVGYDVKFTEQFDDINGVPINGEYTYSSSKQAHNMRLEGSESIAEYTLIAASQNKLLTNVSNNHVIRNNEEMQVSFITELASAKLSYAAYNSGEAISYTINPAVTINNNRGIIPINSNLFGVKEYLSIRVLDNSNNVISETKTFKIERRALRYAKTLFFLNRMGGFDTFMFAEGILKKLKTERSFYKNKRNKRATNINEEIILTLVTGYETTATNLWLKELYKSIEVYIFSTVGDTLTLVVVVSDEFVLSNKDMYQSEIEIEIQEDIFQLFYLMVDDDDFALSDGTSKVII